MRIRHLLAISAALATSTIVHEASAGAHHLAKHIYAVDPGRIVVYEGSRQREMRSNKIRDPASIVRQPLGDLVVANGAIEHQDIPGNIITLADGEGNVTPKYEIKCPDFSPWGISIDAESNIWTTDYDKDEVRAYPSNASGCPAPLVTLKGPHTQIDIPEDVLIDHQGRIIVINYLTSILVFAPDANGDATPLQVIQGPHTHIAHFEGAAIGPDNHIYATSYPNAEVVEYAPDANGDAAPLRIISGNKTGLDAPIGIALDTKGNIYVANFGGHDTVLFAAKAKGNVKPLKVLAPPQNGDLWSPTGVFVR